MSSEPEKPNDYFPSEKAAEHLGMSVKTLIALIKAGGYSYTDMRPGAHNKPPWNRGRHLWGMTAAQLEAVKRGQARRVPSPAEAIRAHGTPAGSPVVGLPGHDGKSRLRRRTTPPRSTTG
jgi:hypothetical protein